MGIWQRVIFISIFFCQLALATDEVPNWVKHPPVEDGQYRFYIGRSSGQANSSEKDLFEQATQDARNTAIAEQFGILTGIDKQSYQSLDSATSVQRVSELSKRVVIKGFQRADQFIKEDGARKDVWVLFRYPKAEITAEIRRLETQTSKGAPPEFSEVNAATSGQSGTIEIVTSPANCNISIDNQSYGLTPAKIRLAEGPHSVFIDHPYFDYVEEQVVIKTGHTTRLNKILSRASRKILIRTNPPQATVTLGGKYLGLSPVETEVVAGEKLPLLIEHLDTQPYNSIIEIGKGSDEYVLKIPDLVLKPSYLSVNSSPQGADVLINGKIYKTPTGFFSAKSGTIKISKRGYIDHEEFVELRGGEHLVLPTVNLTSTSEDEKKAANEKSARLQYLESSPWIIEFGASVFGPMAQNQSATLFGFNLTVGKKFFATVGLKIGLDSYQSVDDSNQKDTSASSGNSTRLSGGDLYFEVPIYFYRNFSLNPEIGRSTTSDNLNSITYHQSFLGFGLEYSNWFDQNSAWGWSSVAKLRSYGNSDSTKGTTDLLGVLGLSYRW